MVKLKIIKKDVNSKVLFNEINNLISDVFDTIDVPWKREENRDLFVEYINSVLYEFWDKESITQWKVICNSLNNTTQDLINGKITLEVFYRQKHCLNTTKITYYIEE